MSNTNDLFLYSFAFELQNISKTYHSYSTVELQSLVISTGDDSCLDRHNTFEAELRLWARELFLKAWIVCKDTGEIARISSAMLLLILTDTKNYSARTRVLLHSLGVLDEEKVVTALKNPTQVFDLQRLTQETAEEHANNSKTLRTVGMGLGALAGGILIGVTGGLAAPLVGAGVATAVGWLGVGGTTVGLLASGLASSTVVCGTLFGAYGAHSMASMIERHTREVKDLSVIPAHSTDGRENLGVVLCVGGWPNRRESIAETWVHLKQNDTFVLQWEVEALIELSNALRTLVQSHAMQYVKAQILKRTILASLMASLTPLAWPVTLVGFSLGALVITEALKRLSLMNAKETMHLIQDVYLFGNPASADRRTWTAIRRLVGGRLVNGYSDNDYILAILSRISNADWNVAGLQCIDVVGIENMRFEQIEGHTDWGNNVTTCMKRMNVAGTIQYR
ncbi:hypothetical protein AMATHDRAFT_72709 [Amanita thiersii Skay4041]|uniref:DUF726 domain-containing protein n=1 Tax=Amanita thiersii Skay4041 TaxID=703135 RepID=A0A2A9NUG6_9AGAR|nr:hypothetical protein AMATHDRAFT_72709 [Amanita thiersii Skay4041]